MCENNTTEECTCCYCTEKRHKIKCLLKPKSPKFNIPSKNGSYTNYVQVILKNDPDQNNPYKITHINMDDPYEFKYTINRNERVSYEDSSDRSFNYAQTSKIVSESEIELYKTVGKLPNKMKYKPNDTIWLVTNCDIIDNEIFYDLRYHNNLDLKTTISEKYLEPYEEPKQKESPKINIGIDLPVENEETECCNRFCCNLFRKIRKILS